MIYCQEISTIFTEELSYSSVKGETSVGTLASKESFVSSREKEKIANELQSNMEPIWGRNCLHFAFSQFYSCFLLSNDEIILNRWHFPPKMISRMVFQTDVDICCI